MCRRQDLRSDFLEPEDPRWIAALQRVRHDVYHLPGYVGLSARSEDARAFAFLYEKDDFVLLIPLLSRPVDGSIGVGNEFVDVTSPYGYPSPLSNADSRCTDGAAFLKQGVSALISSLREQRAVSCFLRFHPLLSPLPDQAWSTSGCLVAHGNTVWIDLEQSEEAIWKAMRSGHRSEVKAGIAQGWETRVEDDDAAYEVFQRIYIATMRRVHASSFYLFGPSYFSDLRRALKGCLHLMTVRIDGAVACGALFTELNGIVQYHLAGTADEFTRLHPSKLLIYSAALWARQRGNQMLHLGGGMGCNDDSLYRFKRGFSDRTGSFCTWRGIVNPDVYRRLCKEWERQSGESTDEPSGFFPGYRKMMSAPPVNSKL